MGKYSPVRRFVSNMEKKIVVNGFVLFAMFELIKGLLRIFVLTND